MPRSITKLATWMGLWMGLMGLLAAGCSAPAKTVDVAQEKTALMERDRAWSESTTDIDKWLGYFTADASVYPSGSPLVAGRDSIRAMFAQFQTMPGFSVHWTATKADVAASGDLGTTAGTYEFKVNDPKGTPTTEVGKYVTVWKKGADGAWMCTDDIFCPDQPSVPPPAAH